MHRIANLMNLSSLGRQYEHGQKQGLWREDISQNSYRTLNLLLHSIEKSLMTELFMFNNLFFK